MSSLSDKGIWESLHLSHKISVWTGSRKTRWMGWPVVGRDAVYASDQYGGRSGGDMDGETVKVDRRSLEVIWRVPSQGWDVGKAHEDLLQVIHQEGEIGARRADTGELLWRRALDGGHSWREFRLAAPWPGRPEAGLLLLDAATGEVRDSLAEVGKVQLGSVHGDLLLCYPPYPRGDGSLDQAVHLGERRVIWARDLRAEIRSRYGVNHEHGAVTFLPASREGRFLVKWHTSLVYVSLEDGSQLWHTRLPRPDCGLVAEGGRLCGLALDQLISLDEMTGEILYDRQYRELERVTFVSGAAAYGDKVAFSSESGVLVVVDASDGRLVWSHKYNALLRGIAEADGRLFATAADGKLLVFEDR